MFILLLSVFLTTIELFSLFISFLFVLFPSFHFFVLSFEGKTEKFDEDPAISMPELTLPYPSASQVADWVGSNTSFIKVASMQF